MGSFRWLVLAGLIACDGDPITTTDTGTNTPTDPGTKTPPPTATYDMVDTDRDGVNAGEDCNDLDPFTYPGAPELCGDGVDQNCDGEVIARNVITWWPSGRNGRDEPFDLTTELQKRDFEVDSGEVVVCGGTATFSRTLEIAEDVAIVSTVENADDATIRGNIVTAFRSNVTARDVTFAGSVEIGGSSFDAEDVAIMGANTTSLISGEVDLFRMVNATVTGNTASAGLFNLEADSVVIDNLSMSGNVAGENSSFDTDGAQLTGITVSGDSHGLRFGGALVADGITVNKQLGSDPALELVNATGTLNSVTIDGNPGDGLRISRDVAPNGPVVPSLVLGTLTSTANAGRGLVFEGNENIQRVSIDGAIIDNNGSATEGGGISVDAPTGELTVTNSSLSGNQGDDGAALLVTNAGSTVFSGVTVSGSTAVTSVVDTTGTVSLSTVSFSSNTSANGVVMAGAPTLSTVSLTGDAVGLSLSGTIVASSVTVTGQTGAGPAVTVVDGEGSFNALTMDMNPGTGLRIERTVPGATGTPALSFTGVTATNQGARGVDVSATQPQDVSITSFNVNTNGDAASGGGVSVDTAGGAFSMTSGSLSGNTGGDGVALHVINAGSTALTGVTINDSVATGSLIDAAGAVSLTDVSLSNNNAPTGVVLNGSPALTNVDVNGDVAGVHLSGTIAVDDLDIVGLTGAGSALTLVDPDGTLDAVTLDNNAGAGLTLTRTAATSGTNLDATSLVVTNHVGRGVHVSATEDQAFTVDGGTVSSNGDATTDGGGIRVEGEGAVVTLLNTAITSNTGNNGGGLHLVDGVVLMSGGSFASNTATAGGAAYVDNVGITGGFSFSGTQFSSNTPEDIFTTDTGLTYVLGAGTDGVCTHVSCVFPPPPPTGDTSSTGDTGTP